MSELPNYVWEYLDEIARDEGFSNYTKEVGAGSSIGDNFQGIMVKIVLNGDRDRDGEVHPDQLSFVLKLPPTDVDRLKEFRILYTFAREVHFYNNVFPVFAKFQKERGLSEEDGFFAYPKCYKAEADEQTGRYVIIMEDLRSTGFSMWPKEEMTAVDHMEMILSQIAKFHAVSFALRDQKPEIFEEFKKLTDVIIGAYCSPKILQLMWRSLERTIDALDDEGHKDIVRNVKANLVQVHTRCVNEALYEPFGVLTHGDFWINNMMFLYEARVSDT